jgi:hypothetical protein
MPNGDGGKGMLPGGAKQVRININLDQLESAVCPSCGANVFDTSYMTYKILPAIQSPTGKAQLIGVPVIICVGCSDLFLIKGDELIPAAKLQETKQSQEPK